MGWLQRKFGRMMCKFFNLHTTHVGLLSAQYVRPKLQDCHYTQHACQYCGKLFEHEYDEHFL